MKATETKFLDFLSVLAYFLGLPSYRRFPSDDAKPVGEGVLEYRIDWGPGYRVYFGRDGETLVILLTGGAKQRQQRDIERAKELSARLWIAARAEHADQAFRRRAGRLAQRDRHLRRSCRIKIGKPAFKRASPAGLR
jgi:hypothetical protein